MADRATRQTDDEQDEQDEQGPSARQLLHWATGDRKAEGEALADDAGPPVSDEDAEQAVKRAHGDLGADEDKPDSDVATPEDAHAEHDER